jgi:hypothetical protein
VRDENIPFSELISLVEVGLAIIENPDVVTDTLWIRGGLTTAMEAILSVTTNYIKTPDEYDGSPEQTIAYFERLLSFLSDKRNPLVDQ